MKINEKPIFFANRQDSGDHLRDFRASPRAQGVAESEIDPQELDSIIITCLEHDLTTYEGDATKLDIGIGRIFLCRHFEVKTIEKSMKIIENHRKINEKPIFFPNRQDFGDLLCDFRASPRAQKVVESEIDP